MRKIVQTVYSSLRIYFNVSGGVYLLFLYIYLLLLSFLKTSADLLFLASVNYVIANVN